MRFQGCKKDYLKVSVHYFALTCPSNYGSSLFSSQLRYISLFAEVCSTPDQSIDHIKMQIVDTAASDRAHPQWSDRSPHEAETGRRVEVDSSQVGIMMVVVVVMKVKVPVEVYSPQMGIWHHDGGVVADEGKGTS